MFNVDLICMTQLADAFQLDGMVSEVIGPLPQIAPVKHWDLALWQGGTWRRGRPM
jgi:hypothetical protein